MQTVIQLLRLLPSSIATRKMGSQLHLKRRLNGETSTTIAR
ncbi:hypothetical protein SAMCCGM7_pA0364 (plasmid) [Sinorhizobium americanum CCGM7]|nr:hypothetical protein SAMCCGM7_pA0364 [Sinorhizobium americanum CCGM7]